MLKIIKEHRIKAIISSLLILVPMAVGAIIWDMLPMRLMTHFGESGAADGSRAKLIIVFVSPLVMLALHWVAIVITCLDRGNRDQSRKALGIVFWIIPAVTLFTSGITFGLAMGKDLKLDTLTPAFFAALFIVFGNFMPKIKRNSTLGIKLPWTVSDDENWERTHRLASKVWIGCGFAFLVAMLLPGDLFVYAILAGALSAAVIPTVYSYSLYRKAKRSGKELHKHTSSRRANIIGIAVVFVTLSAVFVLMFTGDIEVELGENSFTVDSVYCDELTVRYEDIDLIEYRENGESATRILGFGSLRLHLGIFNNRELGNHERYTYLGTDSYIILKSGDYTLVINAETEEATRKLYEELELRTRIKI